MSEKNTEKNQTPGKLLDKNTGRKKTEAIAAILLIAFSIFLIFESLSLKLFSQYGPGPGLFPLGLGIILFILSFALLWENRSPKKKDKASPFNNKKGVVSSGLVVLGLIGYVLIINTFGYLLTTFLLVLFLMGIVARDNIKTTLLTALGVTLLLFLIFQVGLDVHLPKGIFGF